MTRKRLHPDTKPQACMMAQTATFVGQKDFRDPTPNLPRQQSKITCKALMKCKGLKTHSDTLEMTQEAYQIKIKLAEQSDTLIQLAVKPFELKIKVIRDEIDQLTKSLNPLNSTNIVSNE